MKVTGSDVLDKAVGSVVSMKKNTFLRSLRLAESGNSYAQLEVGKLYLNGYGIDTDDADVIKSSTEAFYWFTKSSEQNNAEAFFLLSFCFLEGIGVQKDNEKAIYYLHKAVKLGDVTSMLKLYEIYVAKKKFSKSIFFVENAADKGNADANYALDIHNIHNVYRDEIVVNLEKNLKYLVESADEENKNAQSLLGILYFYGVKVQQDYKKSFYYFEKAATRHEPLAIMNLARCYENGYGIKKNEEIAINLYAKTLDVLICLGSNDFPGLFDEVLSEILKYKDLEDIENYITYPVVLYYLSKEFSGLKRDLKNPEKYTRFLKKSAEMGYDKAQCTLGIMYMCGIDSHIEKNIDKAIELFEKGAKQGDILSINLFNIFKNPDFIPMKKGLSHEYFTYKSND